MYSSDLLNASISLLNRPRIDITAHEFIDRGPLNGLSKGE